jgi:hypothetical protein
METYRGFVTGRDQVQVLLRHFGGSIKEKNEKYQSQQSVFHLDTNPALSEHDSRALVLRQPAQGLTSRTAL